VLDESGQFERHEVDCAHKSHLFTFTLLLSYYQYHIIIPSSIDHSILTTMTVPDDDIDNCKQILSSMLKQETQYLSVHHLHITKKDSNMINNVSRMRMDFLKCAILDYDIVDVSTREKICEWMFYIINKIGMQRETAVIAMNYLDRIMSTNTPRAKRARRNKREYYLVAFSCLYIAVKISEPIMISVDAISELSNRKYSTEAILLCERHILTSLRWKLNGPTPFQFIDYMLLLLLPGNGDDADPNTPLKLCTTEARRQVEVAVHDAACVPLRRSTIFISALLNSLDGVSEDSVSSDDKIKFIRQISDVVGYDVEESLMITACRKRLISVDRH